MAFKLRAGNVAWYRTRNEIEKKFHKKAGCDTRHKTIADFVRCNDGMAVEMAFRRRWAEEGCVGMFTTERAALSFGNAAPKEQTMRGSSIQRYAAMVAVQHQPALPTTLRQPAPEAPAVMRLAHSRALSAPYARPHAATDQMAWRGPLALRWVQAHVALALCTAIVSLPWLTDSTARGIGGSIFVAALLGLTASLWGWQLIQQGRNVLAISLALAVDLLAVAVGLLLLGPTFVVLALVPSALLMTALLADAIIAGVGGLVAFVLYGAALVLNQAGALHPMLSMTGMTALAVHLALSFVGLALLCAAIGGAVRYLHAAAWQAAAATHRVATLERRAQTKRIAIDADAIALQTQLTRAMRGDTPQAVTTCEDLAPLAQMVNSAAARIPGLLRDREERIRLEYAIRDLVNTMETAWAGFTFEWPAPSHTSVDRLVAILRPQPPTEAETNASA